MKLKQIIQTWRKKNRSFAVGKCLETQSLSEEEDYTDERPNNEVTHAKNYTQQERHPFHTSSSNTIPVENYYLGIGTMMPEDIERLMS